MSDVAPESAEPGAAVPDGDDLAAAGATPDAADVQSIEDQIAELQAKRDALNAQAAAEAAPEPEPDAAATFRSKIGYIADVAARDALSYLADHLNL
jgi:hypothetical protein